MLDDFRSIDNDAVGKVHIVGNGPKPPIDRLGMPSMRHGLEPGVGELIRGNYSVDVQKPDADLGTTLRVGWRNYTEDGRVCWVGGAVLGPLLV